MDERLRTFLVIVAAALVLALLVVGIVVLFVTPTQVTSNQQPPVESETPIVAGMLIQGAGCEVDADCHYALNAYPNQKCVSPNCPDVSDPNQPAQGDPAYEWRDSYIATCVNAAQLNNQNGNGEPLEFDTRIATCACQPIPAGPNGEHTSETGLKVCRTVYTE